MLALSALWSRGCWMLRAGPGEDAHLALEAARKQIAALQARLRAVMATNTSLEQQLAAGRNDMEANRQAQQELQQRLASMQSQLAEQASWQVSRPAPGDRTKGSMPVAAVSE